MNIPSLRDPKDLQSWANALVAELDRALGELSRVHIDGATLTLPVYEPDRLPAPTTPGLVVAVRDGTSGVLMLVSADGNQWRRADSLAVY